MNTDQIPLFVEDYTDAIRATVQALGGCKKVGAALRPELAIEDRVEEAGRWLSDCLNPERREILNPKMLALLRRMARQAGCHILAAYEAQDAGYAPPVPLEPEDERAKLEREFVKAAGEMKVLFSRLEKLGR